jgi:hypothetical protein
VQIYLLLLDKDRSFFFADGSHAPGDHPLDGESPAAAATGLRGWLYDWLHRFRDAWDHPESRTMRFMHSAWDWLHSWEPPDEAMLARLWQTRAIRLNYPSGHSDGSVRELWRIYLGRQWWRHGVWMTINAAIAPPALLTLWILPGPNLIGYWFAYRAIHHALVIWGIHRVRSGQVPIEWRPIPALDLPVDVSGDGPVSHPAILGTPALLEEHVDWHHKARRKRAGRPVAAPPEPAGPGAPAGTSETHDHAPVEL